MSRAIHIDGVEYPYRVRRYHVVVRCPDGSQLKCSTSQPLGLSPCEIGRAVWKDAEYPVTPSMVKEWVLTELGCKQ